jgi:hypothetical protein
MDVVVGVDRFVVAAICAARLRIRTPGPDPRFRQQAGRYSLGLEWDHADSTPGAFGET